MDERETLNLDEYGPRIFVARGSYGKVYKRWNFSKGKYEAFKKTRIPQDAGVYGTTLREVSLLKNLQHDNIVGLKFVHPTPKSLFMVMDFYEYTLDMYMLTFFPDQTYRPQLVKMFLRQILEGIQYCHTRAVMHRDLKPNSLLVDPSTKTMKIADFGLARAFSLPSRGYTNEQSVVFIHYRAPELILGSKNYTHSVDMWSVGCIFAEMVTYKILFEANSEIDVLSKMYSILGDADEVVWPGVTSLPLYFGLTKSTRHPTVGLGLANVVPQLDSVGLDLLRRLLTYDPDKRISACAALQHAYFNDMRPQS